VSYDTNLVAQYAQAYVDGNVALMQFYRASLIRPQFLPILDRWEATAQSGQAPTNLLQDQDYLDTQLAGYRTSESAADVLKRESDNASKQAEEYVL
jgi:hypothetical protein